MSRTVESAPPIAPTAGPDSSPRRRWTRGWVPAMRIARRTAWRHRGRTALIAGLVAIPIVGLSTISVVTATSELTAGERADRLFGATDGFVEVTDVAVVDPPDPRYFAPGGYSYSGEYVDRDPATVDLASMLPAGTVLQPAAIELGVTLDTGERLADAGLLGGALDGPLASYRYQLTDGAQPSGPGEAAIDAELADRLGLAIGDQITMRATSYGDDSPDAPADAVPVTITGMAVDASCLYCGGLYVTRGQAETLAGQIDSTGLRGYVDLPADADPVAMWRDLATAGVSFLPRDAVLNPDRYPAAQMDGSYLSLEDMAAFGLVVGFGLLEVVLLAGTAFAVGARRQVRELGLVAANGGERKDVRRIVLAQGVVLGLVGGVSGVVIGFLPLLLGWSQWEQQSGHLFGSVVVSPLQLLGIAAFGVVAGVLAAVIPARTAAKIPVMAALSNRFVAPSKPLRRPLLGVALIAVGGTLSFVAAIRARTLQTVYDAANDALGLGTNVVSGDLPTPDLRLYVVAAVAGLALMAAGLLIGSPALVAILSRLGRFLPLVPRLAMRDAGRHRHRTAPAICAVAIAVGGSVAMGVVFSADDAESRRTYTPFLPLGWATVYGYDDPGLNLDDTQRAQRVDAIDRAAELLGADSTIFTSLAAVAATSANTPGGSPEMDDWTEPVYVACTGPTCHDRAESGQVAVGDADLVAALTGRPVDPAITAALGRGDAVVLDKSLATTDHVRIASYASLYDADELALEEGGGLSYDQELRAISVAAPTYWAMPAAVISAATAAALGLEAQPWSALLSNDVVPTQEQQDRARDVLTGALMDYQVEEGYQSDATLVLLVLLGASALVTIASVAIAVGLAAAEGRADLATLAAVGADPRRRRVLAMSQAAVVGLVGCVLGVGFGVFVAAVGLQGFGIAPWYVPWLLLGAIGLAVPLLAVIVAGLSTRSRLPLARRVAA